MVVTVIYPACTQMKHLRILQTLMPYLRRLLVQYISSPPPHNLLLNHTVCMMHWHVIKHKYFFCVFVYGHTKQPGI